MRGFTLLEVLVSIGILALLAGGIYGVFNAGNTIFYNDIGLLGLSQNARQGMEWMINELREAAIVQIIILDSDSDRIVFNNHNGNGLEYYRDVLDSNADGRINQIIRQDPSGSRRIVANDIARLKFSHPSPYLTIEITAATTVGARPINFSLKENVLLRNE